MYIPDRIYLQVLDGDGEAPDEVTWCVDRIHDTDVEYVRVPSVEVQPVELWVDGGTHLGNPGMGYGSWAFDDVHEYREFGREMTNNSAEYAALLYGLKVVAEHYDVAEVELTVKTDSQLVVGQLAEGWRINAAHLRPLWLEARGLLKAFGSWRMVHVPGETMKKRIGH